MIHFAIMYKKAYEGKVKILYLAYLQCKLSSKTNKIQSYLSLIGRWQETWCLKWTLVLL